VRECESAKVRKCESAKVRKCESAKVRKCSGASTGAELRPRGAPPPAPICVNLVT
jgi:hypothetical protein